MLTAHPTEVSRRTLLLKYNRIGALLATRDRPDLTAPEREDTMSALRRTVLELWETDEVRREKPSPLDEVRWGLAVFEQTLWDAVPRYLRALDRAAGLRLGQALPVGSAPIRFGSWMGGDRDGNPNVTAAVTWRACLMAHWVAAGLYLREVDALRAELSMRRASEELRARCGSAREPYRAILRGVSRRLRATQEEVDRLLLGDQFAPGWRLPGGATKAAGDRQRPVSEPRNGDDPGASRPYKDEGELREVLELCFRSLVSTGAEEIARGRLLDLLRRLSTFGLVLARLDIRQDASLHDRAMDAITGALGEAARWSEWNEERRHAFLAPYLEAGGPRLPLDVPADDQVRAVLDTFGAIAGIPRASLGAYVITMAERASDALAVLALQRAAGVEAPLRVVPLFETGKALAGAGAMLRELLAVGPYRDAAGGHQEVMVGYSDSSKDVGRFSAGWLLYRAQEDIVRACRDAGVALTIFHGRGGSVGRGGGPTHLAIRALPAGAVDGTLRVTEQGEMIQAHYGLPDIAVRTMEVYTTATLEATLLPARSPREEWRSRMDALSAAARAAYRGLVYEHPDFVEYFRAATPEVEIGKLNIGSRPARRTPGAGVGSLRAIPWQFAWTQTRLLLPSWLGLGDALAAAVDSGGRDAIREMYREWPVLRGAARLDGNGAGKGRRGDCRRVHDRALVPERLRPLGAQARARLADTARQVLEATGHRELLEGNRVLKRSIAVRNPYVDPINLLQVELLRRLRSSEQPDESVWTAFAVTVNGIAAGMRNTG